MIGDIEIRDLLVARLRGVKLRDGKVPAGLIQVYAGVIGCTPRHLRRLIAGTRFGGRKRYEIDDEAFEAYFMHFGDATKAYEDLRARAVPLPDLRTFQRAIRRDLSAGDRAFAKHGEKERRKHSVYVTWEAPHRNVVWMGDGKQLDVLVVPERGLTPIRPWLFSFFDAYSRACVGFVLTPSPNAHDVVAALRAAVTLQHPSLGPFRGVPDELILDNALQHFAQEVCANAMALHIGQVSIPPYSPFLLGKIERFHRTLRDEWAAECPFYTHAPERADGTRYHPESEAMTISALTEKLFTFVEFYNRKRPHRALGGHPPEQAWLADPTPLREPDPDVVRRMQIPSEICTVRKKGIEFKLGIYVAKELNRLHGDEVEVRYAPHDLGRVEVFHNDRWLCTAERTDRITRAKAGQIARQRQRDNQRADAAIAKRVMRDKLELDRLRELEALRDPPANGDGSSPPVGDTRDPGSIESTNGSQPKPDSRRSAARSKRARDGVLDVFGLGAALNQAVNHAKDRSDTDVD